MIPKIIHYCWFGRNPLPESAVKCIVSWKKYCPEYIIKQWNEDNFDISSAPLYVRQAYEAHKWAFVSDYVRFWILYRFGGLYFDVDCELIKPLNDLIENGPFMGCEFDGVSFSDSDSPAAADIQVAPGLGLAAIPYMELYKEILKFYETAVFINGDGTLNLETVVKYTTDVLMSHGLKNVKGIQQVGEITVYPKEYLCPMDSLTGNLCITENTYSIHWFAASWCSISQKIEMQVHKLGFRFGINSKPVERILSFPFRVFEKFSQIGVKKTLIFAKKKLFKQP